MKLTYALDAEDMLQYQLYAASHSPSVQRNRRRSWIVATLAFAVLAGLFYQEHIRSLALYFSVLAVASALLYPLYSRWRYKRHYRRHIESNYRKQLGEPVSLELTDTLLLATDKGSRNEAKLSELSQIVEMGCCFLLRFNAVHSLIIPKDKLPDAKAVKDELVRLANLNGIQYVDDQSWRWK